MRDDKKWNTIVVGGGFYGLSVALFLRDELGVKDILVIEKEPTTMSRASYANQARIHMGYHYPRSVLTAYRSAVNFPRFVREYSDAVVDNFDKYYAISKVLSKVNGRQFVEFSHKIGADIEDAPGEIQKLFNPSLTDGVYKVREYAFDSHILRDLLLRKIKAKPGIKLHTSEEVAKLIDKGGVEVQTDKGIYSANKVLSCTYSQLNNLHRNSGIELIPLKHEITELCLVRLPPKLKDFSVTVMDGPFFSIMPFPTRGLHTLTHVRYTPHESWVDTDETASDRHNPHRYLAKRGIRTNYKKMHADVVRYIPALKNMEYADTINEVKTVLQRSEDNDSRPILFRSRFGIPGYTCIMGGKLDNIYDVFEDLKVLYGKE